MSVRTETLQLRVVVDGSPARRELATLDQEYARINSELRDLKKNTEAYNAATTRLGEIRTRQEELRKEIGLTGLTAKQLGDELRRLQIAQRNLTPNTQLWAENAERIEQVKNRLRELNDVNARAQAAWERQRGNIRLLNMSMLQLEMESKRLKAALSTMDPTTPLFARTKRELDAVERRMKEVSAGTGFFGGLRNAASSMTASMLGWGAAIYGTVQGIRTMISWTAQLSDQLAEVRKTTGLTGEEVEKLSSRLMTLDTRTSQEALLGLAREAGKLGISAPEDIFRFVRAADQINVALGEDLGEGALTQIGKLVQTFGVTAREGFDLERSMLSVGSAINELGASSTASEGYLVDFTSRMAGANTQAGISLENTLGYAAALDQLGQRSETASTALAQFTLKAFQDTATYAKIAGMELGEFQRLLNTDANEALLRTLQGLNGNGAGLQRMTGLFADMGQEGARAVGVLASLAQNVDLVRQQQDIANGSFAEGVSVTDEFNTKNTTLAAEIEKLGNAWRAAVTSIDQGNSLLSQSLRGIIGLLRGAADGLRQLIGGTEIDNRQEAFVAAVEQRLTSIYGEAVKESADYKRSQKEIAEEMRARRVATEGAIEADLELLLLHREQTAARLADIQVNQNQTAFWKVRTAALRESLAQMDAEIAKRQASAASTAAAATEGNKPVEEVAAQDAQKVQREREERVRQMEQLRRELDAVREGIYQNGLSDDERDLRQLDVKHAAELAKLKANALATEEDLRALEEAQARERAELIEAQGDERVRGYSEAADRIRRATLDSAALQLEDEMAKWDQLIALAKKYGIDSAELEKAKGEAEAKIRKGFRDKETAEAEKADRAQLQSRIQTYQAMGQAVAGLNSFLSAIYADAQGRAFEDTEWGKALALVQIATNAAVAVSQAVRSSTVGEPYSLAARVAVAVGAVLGAIGQAYSVLRSAPATPPPPSTGSAAGSGPSSISLGEKGMVLEGPSHADDGLTVLNPKTGQPVAELEGGELVLSKLFTRNNADLVPLLLQLSATGARLPIGRSGGVFGRVAPFNFREASEALAATPPGHYNYTFRKGGSGLMAEGGGGMGSDAETKALLRAIAAGLANPMRVQAVVSTKELDRRKGELEYLQDQGRVRRLK